MRKTATLAAVTVLGSVVLSIPATAADSAAGQKTFEGICAACHQLKSYAGKSESDLETQVKGIVAGTIKHPKKLTLSASEIADVATYIASNESK